MSSLSWWSLLLCLVAAALTIGVLMGTTMAISMRLKNWSVVDTFWGLGFIAIAVVSYLISLGHGDSGRRLIALLVTATWGVRLAGYIHWRNHGKPEDPRYTSLMKRRTGALLPYVIKTIFWAQGWVMWVVAIPISVAMVEHQKANVITWIGVALAAIGIFFETVGDAQLAHFKADPSNEGKIMNHGLWSWTRHPNYFGDICVMFAFWLIACGAWVGVVTVFAPILMSRMLIATTGKAMLERRMARKRGPEYAAYVACTSGLFPRPPRKAAPRESIGSIS